ncbi:hypothetical protein [Streptococcus suis]|uniref:hypothetical protein n=1 Tax=Streptococcus suis TaxID=1307 RepID=UPI000C181F8D|nr:hypothetical protein [Streptococcus suis]
MDGWKTMLEVSKELKITKSAVKYHRQKLADEDVKIQDGVTYISAPGITKIKTFLRSSDHSEDFETRVENQLNLIQELLMEARPSPEKNSREAIEHFREFLIRSSDSLEVLYEQERQSKDTLDSEFYFSLIDYIERKKNVDEDFFRQ